MINYSWILHKFTFSCNNLILTVFKLTFTLRQGWLPECCTRTCAVTLHASSSIIRKRVAHSTGVVHHSQVAVTGGARHNVQPQRDLLTLHDFSNDNYRGQSEHDLKTVAVRNRLLLSQIMLHYFPLIQYE